MDISHLWLVPTGVQHHPPVGAIAAVAEAELLHEDLVLPVLPSLDDQPFQQLVLAKIHLQPFAGKGLGLGQQGPSRPAGQQAGVLRYPAAVRMGGGGDLVVCDQPRYHAQHARAWVLCKTKRCLAFSFRLMTNCGNVGPLKTSSLSLMPISLTWPQVHLANLRFTCNKKGESQSEPDNSSNSLWCCCHICLHSLWLQISCILIPLPEAVVSRQPIKTLLLVGASASCTFWECYLFSSPLSTPSSLCRLTYTNTQTLFLFVLYLLLHLLLHMLSTSVGPCLLTPRCFRCTFSDFLLLLYSTSLILPYPDSLWFQCFFIFSFFGCMLSHLFQRGDSCFLLIDVIPPYQKPNRKTTCCCGSEAFAYVKLNSLTFHMLSPSYSWTDSQRSAF